MATQTFNWYLNYEGAYVDLPYDDVSMTATNIHVVVPAGAHPLNVHIVTVKPNRTINQTFQPGTDQLFPVGNNLPITMVTNSRGFLAPKMEWLVEYAMSGA